jgi:hypothetical protein
LAELERDFKNFHSFCKQGKLKEIKKYTQKYNTISYSNEDGLNGLMIGAMSGNVSTMDYFLDEGIDRNLKNSKGLGAVEQALLRYTDNFDDWYKEHKSDILTMSVEKKKAKLTEELIKIDTSIVSSYEKLHYPYIKYQIGKKMMKIYPNSMEYFLMIYLITLKEKINKKVEKLYIDEGRSIVDSVDDCLNMNDFTKYITNIPSYILPDYRKKRQYINSILAKNEIDSNNYYNKKLFVRRSRGCYDLNPELTMWG